MARRVAPMGHRARTVLFAAVFVLLLAVDQAVKAWARAGLDPAAVVTLVPHVLGLTLVQNGGAAFGMMQGATILLVVCAVAVTAGCCVALRRFEPANPAEVIALGMISSGGVGNAIDRVSQGSVTDMLTFLFMNFPVFNVADVALTCGFVILVATMFALARREGVES